MEMEPLSELIKQGYSQRRIAAYFLTSQTNVCYWLKVHNLKTGYHREIYKGFCGICEREIPNNRRKRCGSCTTRIRRLRSKLKAIEIMGGKCVKCGWHGPPAGFEFHHNIGEKEFMIGMVANKSWDLIKRELEKCILLCATCHRIEHSSQSEKILIEAMKSYRGRLLNT